MPIIASIASWLVYFGLTAGIIVWDGKVQQRAAKERGSVDFMDRKPTNYLILAIFCGPLPLIAYFGITRKKSLVGWLMGVAAATFVYIVTFGVSFVMTLLFGR